MALALFHLALSVADLRKSYFVLVPLQALDGVSLPPQVALQLGTELIRYATAWSMHGPEKTNHNTLKTR